MQADNKDEKPLRAPIAIQEDDLDDTPPLSPPIGNQEGDVDDSPLSPPIVKQEYGKDDTPESPPITKQEDDMDNTPLSPPITNEADGKEEMPLHEPITKHKHFSADDLKNIILKLKKIRTNWFECNSKLKQLSEDVIKFKADLDKERIIYKIEVILGDKSKIESEKPKVPFGLVKSVYQNKQSQVHCQADERLYQQDFDFRRQRNLMIEKQHLFESFHRVLQTKVKLMENLTPEMFCNFTVVERSKLLEKFLLSLEQCYMEKRCGEAYDEVIRNNNMLRITYGFPEKPEQDDIDEIEKKFTNYKRLCDNLKYSLY